jgi:transcriptional regulator with XRE-family HTH domain
MDKGLVKAKDYVLKEAFCINLKWYRFKENLTQEKLAELSNSTPKYISDLERGKFYPSFSKIVDLANAFNIEPYQLLMPNHLDDKIEYSRIDNKR